MKQDRKNSSAPVPPQTARPGHLVLVAGPSGAGKDSIIAAAAARLRTDGRFVFPARVVTRASSVAEAHDSMSREAFAAAREDGAFAFVWGAHGLDYGIPTSIEADFAAGRTVVCNVSRTVVGTARERFGRAMYIEITAPAEVLRSRLVARGRETVAEIDARLARQAVAPGGALPDVVIGNGGSLDDAVERFLAAIGAGVA